MLVFSCSSGCCWLRPRPGAGRLRAGPRRREHSAFHEIRDPPLPLRSGGGGVTPAPHGTPALPACSVIVPTYDRPHELAACLAAIADLDYPRELLEVVVVDDGGAESLEDVVAAVQGRVAAVLLRQPRQGGPAAARNAGALHTSGDLLAFTDDDCRPASDWLRLLAEHHVAEPNLALGGHTENELAGVSSRRSASSSLTPATCDTTTTLRTLGSLPRTTSPLPLAGSVHSVDSTRRSGRQRTATCVIAGWQQGGGCAMSRKRSFAMPTG